VPGGAEEVLREICRLVPDAAIFTAQFNPERFPWLRGRDVRATWVSKMPFSKSRHYLYAPILADVYRSMDLREFDVVLTSSHSFAHGVRKRPDALHFCYYYTPARSLWFPEIDKRAGNDPLRKMIAKRLRRLDLIAARGPDVAYAISETSAQRVRDVYKRPCGVIYPGVDTRKYGDVVRELDDGSLLMWGRLIRYKKFDLGIEAAKLLGRKLHVVGSGPFEPQLRKLAGDDPNIVFHGRLPDADLKALLSRCFAVLFPPYEDYGIVPIEALAAGVPVVAFGEGGARETIPPTCGALFTSQTPEALAEAVRSLEAHSFDPQALRRQAARFDNQVFRFEYTKAVNDAVEAHFPGRAPLIAPQCEPEPLRGSL